MFEPWTVLILIPILSILTLLLLFLTLLLLLAANLVSASNVTFVQITFSFISLSFLVKEASVRNRVFFLPFSLYQATLLLLAPGLKTCFWLRLTLMNHQIDAVVVAHIITLAFSSPSLEVRDAVEKQLRSGQQLSFKASPLTLHRNLNK